MVLQMRLPSPDISEKRAHHEDQHPAPIVPLALIFNPPEGCLETTRNTAQAAAVNGRPESPCCGLGLRTKAKWGYIRADRERSLSCAEDSILSSWPAGAELSLSVELSPRGTIEIDAAPRRCQQPRGGPSVSLHQQAELGNRAVVSKRLVVHFVETERAQTLFLKSI